MNYKLFGVLSILVNPVLGAVVNIFLIFLRKKISYYFISFSIVLIYSYFPILWDVRNNYYEIYVFQGQGFNLYTQLIYFITSTLKVSYISVIFFISVLIACIYAHVYSSFLEMKRFKGSFFTFLVLFILFLMNLGYLNTFGLQKTALSVAFFILGYQSTQSMIKNIFFIISILIHPFSFILVVAKYISGIVLSSKFTLLIVWLCLSISIYFVPLLLDFVISISGLSSKAMFYFESQNNRFSSEVVASFVWGLRVGIVLLVSWLFFLEGKKNKNIDINFILVLSAFLLLLSFQEIFLERLYYAFSIVVVYILITNVITKKRFLLIGFFLILNFSIHEAYTYNIIFSDKYEVISNKEAVVSMTAKLFYLPTPALLMFKHFGYSNDYIEKNTN